MFISTVKFFYFNIESVSLLEPTSSDLQRNCFWHIYICIFLAALLLLHNLVIILCGTATKSHPFQLYIVILLMNDVKILNSAQQKGKVILTVWVVAVNIPFLTFVQPVSVVNYANLPKTTVGSGFNDWVANASFVKPSSSADMKA